MRLLYLCLIAFGFCISGIAASAQGEWRVANLRWHNTCAVDSGAIRREGDGYVFQASRNHCSGGIFGQRAEIQSEDISVSRRASYVFDTTMVFESSSLEPLIIFQIHDGRVGCSPPMSLRWNDRNVLSFDSDYTRDRGMDGCVENRELRDARYYGPVLRRDGTAYRLQVILNFDGHGAFDVVATLDGQPVLSGRYSPSRDPQFVTSTRFHMKHGVYSQNIWPYVMRSVGMRVLTGG